MTAPKTVPTGADKTKPVDRIGIIAGGGSLPLEVARSVSGRGGYVHVVMIEGEADDALQAFPHEILNWAELGRAARSFKRAGISDVIMVGRMARPSFKTARPDFGFLASLPKVLKALRAGGDDAVLRGVVGLLEARRLRVLGVTDVAPELLISDGPLSFQQPTGADEIDIAKGLALVGALGPYDIGQAVIVTDGVVEAIEGAEGTDRMIARVRDRRLEGGLDLARVRKGVLVKRPKPGQDPRLDMPAIGPDTVAAAADAGLAGIAGMTGEVLAASRFEMIARADRAGLFVAGVRGPEDNAYLEDAFVDPIVFGGVAIPAAAGADVAKGVYAMSELAQLSTGSALVIADGRVLAVGADEGPEDVLYRAAAFLRKKRRSAVVILGPQTALDAKLIEAAAHIGLQGVILTFGAGDGPRHTGPILDIADRLRIFVAGTPVLMPASP
jgi:DUF1009 family protein